MISFAVSFSRHFFLNTCHYLTMKHSYRSFFLLLGLLSCLGSGQAQAQTNFRPGYVLPLTGDTLRGEVDFRDARLSAQRCQFRASAQAPSTTYSPAELRGYGVPAEFKHYRAFPVAVDSAAAQPYFLEVLADGPATLYFLRDANQHEVFYLASPTLALTQLKHSFARVVRDGHVYTEEQNPFRNTLALGLQGCPAVQSHLPRLPYKEKELRNVVAQYNACQGKATSLPTSAAPGSHALFGVMAGPVQQRLSYDGYPFLGQASFVTKHTGFVVGPTLHITSRRLPKLSVVASLFYETEKYDMEGIATLSETGGYAVYREFRTHYDLAYLRLPVMLRYTYPRGTVRPLVEVGFSGAYALKRDNTYEERSYFTGRVSAPATLLEGDAFRRYQVGYSGGLGLSTQVSGRAVALLGRAEVANGFSDIAGLGTYVVHLYALLSFDLNK
jgi:hypothetical protein